MIGLLLIAATLLGSEPTDNFVVVYVEAEERPRDRVAEYSALCLSNSLANRAIRTNLGIEETLDPYAGVRAQAAELALESPEWGYLDIATTMLERASEIAAPLAIVIESLERGEQPPPGFLGEEALLQVQSDCQREIQERMRRQMDEELDRLSGITTVDGLLQCAAISLERARREPPEALLQLSDDLAALAQQYGRSGLDPDTDIQYRRDVFLTQFFADETGTDSTYSDLLAPHLTQCDRMVADLRTAGHLPP